MVEEIMEKYCTSKQNLNTSNTIWDKTRLLLFRYGSLLGGKIVERFCIRIRSKVDRVQTILRGLESFEVFKIRIRNVVLSKISYKNIIYCNSGLLITVLQAKGQ